MNSIKFEQWCSELQRQTADELLITSDSWINRHSFMRTVHNNFWMLFVARIVVTSQTSLEAGDDSCSSLLIPAFRSSLAPKASEWRQPHHPLRRSRKISMHPLLRMFLWAPLLLPNPGQTQPSPKKTWSSWLGPLNLKIQIFRNARSIKKSSPRFPRNFAVCGFAKSRDALP